MNKTKTISLIISIITISIMVSILIFVFSGKSQEDKQKELVNAIQQNNITQIKKMVEQNYPLNFLTKDGLTPLETALNDHSLETAAILLKNGAKTNKKVPMPLFVQIVSVLEDYRESIGDPKYPKQIKEIKNLLKLASQDKANNINAKNDMGNTALQIAAMSGHPDIIRYLLQLGSDPDVTNKYQETPLLIAVKAGQLEAVKLLYPYHNRKLDRDYNGNGLISSAAMDHQSEVLQYLLQQDKSGINDQNRDGKTALMISAEYGFTDIVKLLLQNGANPALKSKEGKTALDYALHWKHEDIIKLLQRG